MEWKYSKQLFYDTRKEEIIDEPIKYWKSSEDIPDSVKEKIIELCEYRAIYDSEIGYCCSKCLGKLDENFFCNECGKQRVIVDNDHNRYVNIADVKSIRFSTDEFYFYLFDVVDDEVLLYVLKILIKYERDEDYKLKLVNYIEIENAFHILEDGILDLGSEKLFSFYDLDKIINDDNFDYELYDFFYHEFDKHFLFVDNLDVLKKSRIYKYSCIWEMKDYLRKNNFNLLSITYYPVHFKQFEYLIKMQLFKLAFTGIDLLKEGKNFKEIFGVDKKYYTFMKKNDISREQFEALRLYPTEDIEIIDFIEDKVFLFYELAKYVDCKRLKKYFDDEMLTSENLFEYSDYIEGCNKLGLNLADKKVLYPKGFIECHDDITNRVILMNAEETDEKIHTLSNFLGLNVYDDGKFVIFPADSVNSLIDESSQMSNCVRNYCSSIGNNDCQIYFMRYKDSIAKSLVTVEVVNGKIVQARTRFNQEPTDEMWEALYKWEKQLIPVFKSEEENIDD